MSARSRNTKIPSRPIGDDRAWADAILCRAIEHLTEISDWQADFTMSMADRIDKFGAAMFVSVKQMDALRQLDKDLEKKKL